MTTFVPPTVLEPLRTDRTIARDLVHRIALEEVFLTDFQNTGDGFAAAARLPRSHPYYCEHTAHPSAHDPIAVFECVRQMLLCAMHLHHGVTADTKSVTASCELEITDPRALAVAEGGYELTLLGRVVDAKEREGVAVRVVHEVDVLLGTTRIGRVRVDTALKQPESYQRLRMRSRVTPPSLSVDLVAQEPVSRVAPYLVGRQQTANVLLIEPEINGSVLTASLRVPVSHPGMFDHPHDHVPGPVLMEAARQAGHLLQVELFGLSPAKTTPVELRAAYERFTELDSEILIRASFANQVGPGQPIYVHFRQDGDIVADMRLRMGSTVGHGT